MNKLILLVFFINVYNLINAQNNLIPNYSFEEYKQLPDYTNQANRIKLWIDVNNSCEYYNLQAKKLYEYFKTTVTENQHLSPFNIDATIHLKPKTGNGYIGIMNDERDLLFIELEQTLIPKHWYIITFYINHSTNKIINIKETPNIALYLKEKITNNDSLMLQVNYTKDIEELAINKWLKLEGKFQARGGEKFLYIGGFSKNKSRNRTYYYCIDDIVLRKVNSINEAFHTKNICFETNEAKLVKKSYKILHDIITYLKSNNVKLEISGHTDNTGTEQFNLELSENRAKAVYDYFIEHRIDKSRLKYKGYGSSRPLISNDNEENRAKNRRVEIKIIK